MFEYCTLCPGKVILEEKGNYCFECPKCRRQYIRYYEVIAREDQLQSTHEDQAATLETAGLGAGGPGLMAARDDDFPTLDEIMEEEHNRGKIPIPKYMKNGPVTTVEEFHEELLE